MFNKICININLLPGDSSFSISDIPLCFKTVAIYEHITF